MPSTVGGQMFAKTMMTMISPLLLFEQKTIKNNQTQKMDKHEKPTCCVWPMMRLYCVKNGSGVA
jgi:hypothetical protein